MNFDEKKELIIETLREITGNIEKNIEIINKDKIIELVDLIVKIYASNNMVFVYGAGRSGFIGRCFAQRLMHLGIKSCFVSDAVTHQYKDQDLLILITGSGETTSPVAIAQKAKEIGGKIAVLTGNPYGTISKLADIIIEIEGKSKEKATSKETLAPYTTLFDVAALSILDTIGGTIMKVLGVTEQDIDDRHASIE